MEGVVVIFDFDCTILEVDSDPWVAQQLGASQIFERLRADMPGRWNEMMDALMQALHAAHGATTLRLLRQALLCAPLHPQKIAAIKAAHALGCELRIVSDANDFFIRTILDEHGLTHMFREIHTNPSHLQGEGGRLHIGSFHPKSEPPHGCPLCPPNMCKGSILDRIRDGHPPVKTRMVYVGDGIGDLCPSLRLASRSDTVLARAGFPLLELLVANWSHVKASAYAWMDSQDLHDKLINAICMAQPIDDEPARSSTSVLQRPPDSYIPLPNKAA